jgi:menaquinol-cytochrome c reductase cytochrome b subunit
MALKIPIPGRKKETPPGDGSGNGNGNGNGAAPENGNGAGPTRAERVAKAKELSVHHGTAAAKNTTDWLDERVNGTGIYTAMLSRKVPKGTNWFYTLGSSVMFIFAMQAITGVFLAMYYVPSATQAYASISHITNDVFLGEFVRGLHKWGASLMIILIFLHMARTFFFGAYKYPRELNWVIGVVLIVLTMVMGLTGYLLPFDQRSFWATIVANNITASGPVLGPYLADFLRAGPDFSATTLSRFYALHMLVVPGLIAGLIGAHLFLVVKLGTTAPPWVRASRPKGARPSEMIPAGVPAVDGAELTLNGHSGNGHVEVSGNGASAPAHADSNGSPDGAESPDPDTSASTETPAEGEDA